MPTRLALLLALLAHTAPADTLTGRVVEDHSNTPLPSVELRVYRTGQRQLAAHLETDSSGQFTAEGLSTGEYRIEASKPNFLGATLRLSAIRDNLVIRLVRCGVISGRVVDAAGAPIRGVAVYALPKTSAGVPLQPGNNPIRGHSAEANESGQYRLHNLPPGEYAVAAAYGASSFSFGRTGGGASRPGLGSGVQVYPTTARPNFFAVTGGEDYRNIDFTITPGTLAKVSGKLDRPDPKSSYWLALSPADQPSLAAAVTATKDDGSFQFEGIGPGNYQLTASGPVRGYGGVAILGPEPFFGRTQVSVGSGDIENLAIPLQKGRTLTFTLAPTPKPDPCPASGQLTLTPIEDWAARLTRTAELNFAQPQTITHIAPARYQLTLARLGDSCYQPEATTLDLTTAAPDQPIAIRVAPAGLIRGKLTGATAPTSFAVALLSADTLNNPQPMQLVFPDATGHFSFAALRPGRYRIGVQRAAGATRADIANLTEVQVAAGAPTALELRVPPQPANQ